MQRDTKLSNKLIIGGGVAFAYLLYRGIQNKQGVRKIKNTEMLLGSAGMFSLMIGLVLKYS
jgi:3-phosphoglycerate kinase